MPASNGQFELGQAEATAVVTVKRGRTAQVEDFRILGIIPIVLVDFGDRQVRLHVGAQSVDVDVTVACPHRTTGQPFTISVLQGETSASGGFVPVWDGHPHLFTVTSRVAKLVSASWHDSNMLTNGRFEELAERARSMRAEGATHAEIKTRLRVGSSTVSRMLGVAGKGSPRPRIRPEIRERARSLRLDGKTVPEISRELEISRSTAWLITKEIAWTSTHDVATRQADAARRRWQAYEERREVERKNARQATMEQVGGLSDRELLLIGAVLYWAEGTKSKPWGRREYLVLINSDPDVIRLSLPGCGCSAFPLNE